MSTSFTVQRVREDDFSNALTDCPCIADDEGEQSLASCRLRGSRPLWSSAVEFLERGPWTMVRIVTDLLMPGLAIEWSVG